MSLSVVKVFQYREVLVDLLRSQSGVVLFDPHLHFVEVVSPACHSILAHLELCIHLLYSFRVALLEDAQLLCELTVL